jgi:uncharacterized protein YuzE
MEITYDKDVDALNVSLRSGAVAKTLEIAPEIMVDLDKKGNTLNIEIIGASGDHKNNRGQKARFKTRFGDKIKKNKGKKNTGCRQYIWQRHANSPTRSYS